MGKSAKNKDPKEQKLGEYFLRKNAEREKKVEENQPIVSQCVPNMADQHACSDQNTDPASTGNTSTANNTSVLSLWPSALRSMLWKAML